MSVFKLSLENFKTLISLRVCRPYLQSMKPNPYLAMYNPLTRRLFSQKKFFLELLTFRWLFSYFLSFLFFSLIPFYVWAISEKAHLIVIVSYIRRAIYLHFYKCFFRLSFRPAVHTIVQSSLRSDAFLPAQMGSFDLDCVFVTVSDCICVLVIQFVSLSVANIILSNVWLWVRLPLALEFRVWTITGVRKEILQYI